MKIINLHIQEARWSQRVPIQMVHRTNLKRETKKIMNSARGKITHHIQGKLNKYNADFSSEIMKARRKWDDIVNSGKKSILKNEGEIKILPDEQKLGVFVSCLPALQ